MIACPSLMIISDNLSFLGHRAAQSHCTAAIYGESTSCIRSPMYGTATRRETSPRLVQDANCLLFHSTTIPSIVISVNILILSF